MKAPKRQKITVLYSRAFKLKVVKEIEEGKFNRFQARELYGIKGTGTINSWIRKLGKNYLLNKVVRIELKDEPSKLKELKLHTQKLEKALAEAHLRLLAYDSLLEVADEELGTNLKKNLELRLSSGLRQKGRKASGK
jgi:transposase